MRLIFVLLLISNFIYTQEDSRTWIRGKVLYKNSNVISANVVNNTSREATITDNDGELITIDSDERLEETYKNCYGEQRNWDKTKIIFLFYIQ